MLLTIGYPPGASAWLSPELIKGAVDGVVSVFQAHRDVVTLAGVAARIAASTGENPVAVTSMLLNTDHAVLGVVDHLVRPWRNHVQWNPSDHMCMAGQLRCVPVTGDYWQLSGEVWALAERH